MIQKKSKIKLKAESLKYQLLRPIGVRRIIKSGFWFVDIPRTSSTSIKVELGKNFGSVFSKNDVFEKRHRGFQFFPNHLPARVMRDYVGKEQWNNIFSFTIVRNPWDRVVSLYHYRLKSRLLRQDMGFREYILKLKDSEFGQEPFRFFGHYYGCSDFVTDENDNIIVSYIARYETRENDLKYVAEKINFPELGKLTVQKATPKKKHYSEYYDEDTIKIIKNIYHKDIELFGYKFETKE